MDSFLDAVLVLILLVGLSGVALAVWSYMDTRNRYYKDYIARKGK